LSIKLFYHVKFDYKQTPTEARDHRYVDSITSMLMTEFKMIK